jgi:hypothetical protein
MQASSLKVAEIQVQKIAPIQELKVSQLQKTGTLQAEVTKLAELQTLRVSPAEATKVGEMQAQKVGSAQATKLAEVQATRVATAQALKVATISVSTPTVPTVRVPTFNIPFGFLQPPLSNKSREKEDSQAYNAFAKDKGAWVKVTDKPVNRTAALNTGAYYADNSTAASYKITATKGEPTRSDAMQTYSTSKFSQNKKGIFVEKNRHRIDTAGELKGITAKGLKQLELLRSQGFKLNKKAWKKSGVSLI